MMAQVMRGAAAPVPGTIGGSGPTQVGLGMTLNSIGSIMTQGSLQTTGQWSDIGLNGDGYFMVGTGLDATDLVQTTSQVQFTRAGNFTVDKDGYLTDQHGNFVLGLQAPPPPQTPPITFGTTLGALKLPNGASSVSIDQNGVMSYDLNGRQILGKLQLAKFPNPAGLSRVGGEQPRGLAELRHLRPDRPDRRHERRQRPRGDANTQGLGSMASGALEMSNVDLALEFTNMIVAQRGFQANTPRHHDVRRGAAGARQPEALIGAQRAHRRAANSRRRRLAAGPPPVAVRPRRCARRCTSVRMSDTASQAGGERRHDQAPPRTRSQGDLGQRRPDRDRRGDARHRLKLTTDRRCSSPRRRRRSRRSSSSTSGWRKLALTFSPIVDDRTQVRDRLPRTGD